MPLLMADSEKKKKTAESPKESSRRKRENRLKNQLKKSQKVWPSGKENGQDAT